MLLSDHDRIWGVFDLGKSKGLVLIDPNPKLPLSDGEPPQSFDNGMRKTHPDMSLCNELYTKGKIHIDLMRGTVAGHFELMSSNGDAGALDNRCEFTAKKNFGPTVVPYSLSDVVEEWNEYNPLAPEEIARQDLSREELARYRSQRDAAELSRNVAY